MFLPLNTHFLMVGKKITLVFVKAKQIWLAKKLYVYFHLLIDVLTSVFINNFPSFKCKKNHLHGTNGPSIFLQVKHKTLPLESTHIPLNEISSSWGSLNMHFLIVKTFIENRSLGDLPNHNFPIWILYIYFLRWGKLHVICLG